MQIYGCFRAEVCARDLLGEQDQSGLVPLRKRGFGGALRGYDWHQKELTGSWRREICFFRCYVCTTATGEQSTSQPLLSRNLQSAVSEGPGPGPSQRPLNAEHHKGQN